MNATPSNIKHHNKKPRFLIEEKMAQLLKDSYYQPANKEENGVFFIDNFHFAVNIKALGSKLGIQCNSLNKDFRHHKIICIQRLPLNSKSNLFDGKGWKIYRHSNNDFSLENILKGNNQLTTKWANCKNKNKLKINDKNIPINNQYNDQNIPKTIINIKDKILNKEEIAVQKVMHTISNSKSSGTNEFSSEDADNYMNFFT